MKKESIIKSILTAGIVPFVIKLFLKHPALVSGISAIPVMQWFEKRFKLTAVLSKIVGVLIFLAIMAVSWHAAEVVVVLAAVAIAAEIIHWVKVIQTKWVKYYGRNSLPGEIVDAQLA